MTVEHANARVVEVPLVGHAPGLSEREAYPEVETFLQ
jgi:hypothetical protein